MIGSTVVLRVSDKGGVERYFPRDSVHDQNDEENNGGKANVAVTETSNTATKTALRCLLASSLWSVRAAVAHRRLLQGVDTPPAYGRIPGDCLRTASVGTVGEMISGGTETGTTWRMVRKTMTLTTPTEKRRTKQAGTSA